MSRSSEEVLLSVPHVRHRKTDGTLYLMAERLGWMVQSKKQNAFTVIHKYADVRSQKISPEGKPKIQLQVRVECRLPFMRLTWDSVSFIKYILCQRRLPRAFYASASHSPSCVHAR